MYADSPLYEYMYMDMYIRIPERLVAIHMGNGGCQLIYEG